MADPEGKSGHVLYPVWILTFHPSSDEIKVRYWETY